MIGNVMKTGKSVQLEVSGYNFKKCTECKSRVTTSDWKEDLKVDVLKIKPHSHSPKSKNSWETKLDELLKTHQMIKPSVIINKIHASCQDVPNEQILRGRITYYRHKNEMAPINLDTNLKTLGILNNQSENFILFDNLGDEFSTGRLIIFGCNSVFNINSLHLFYSPILTFLVFLVVSYV